MIQSGNILYGSTFLGGAANRGTIFSFDLSTGVESILYSFQGGIQDGGGPAGPITLVGNSIFGMTTRGGDFDQGTVFSLNRSTQNITTLHSADYSETSGNQLFTDGGFLLVGNTLYGTSFRNELNVPLLFSITNITIPEPTSLALLILGSTTLLTTRRRRS